MSEELDNTDPGQEGEETVIEVLDGDFPVPAGPSVRLTGDAARDVTDLLGSIGTEALEVHGRSQALFLVAPSPEVSKQLADGSLRWANSRKSDASVLIKHPDNGRIAAQGHLVRSNLTKVLGPAAWQAMAMATQQHYLVSIDNKLAGLKGSLDELRAENEDERLGPLDSAARTASRVLQSVSEQRRVSGSSVAQLVGATQEADERFHQLLRQAQRHADNFARDEGEPGEAERAWAELLYALQVLSQCSLALVSLPHANVEELEAVGDEERRRIQDAVERTLTLAGELTASDARAREAYDYWERNRFRRRAFAKDAALEVVEHLAPGPREFLTKRFQGETPRDHWARRREVKEPQLKALDRAATDTLQTLVRPAEPAPPMLVAVNADGSVEVRAHEHA